MWRGWTGAFSERNNKTRKGGEGQGQRAAWAGQGGSRHLQPLVQLRQVLPQAVLVDVMLQQSQPVLVVSAGGGRGEGVEERGSRGDPELGLFGWWRWSAGVKGGHLTTRSKVLNFRSTCSGAWWQRAWPDKPLKSHQHFDDTNFFEEEATTPHPKKKREELMLFSPRLTLSQGMSGNRV